MSRSTRTVAGGLAAVVATATLATMAAGTSQAAQQPTEVAVPITPEGATHQVTLITGDIVTVTDAGTGPGTASVEEAPGNTGGIQIQQIGDDLHVVPDSALPYLASGRLDPELFDVTSLIEQGYDDASVNRIPLIVQYPASLRSQPAAPKHADKGSTLESIHGAALAAHKGEAEKFWDGITATTSRAASEGTFAGGIAKIHLDGQVEATLSGSVAQVGAPEAWAAGYDGAGVTVAVLDTGVDETHPDLVDQITETKSFVPDEGIADVHGHGTHVASTVAGTGAASGGTEKGVAPGSDLVIGKVLSDAGNGADSWIIEGMEWAAARADVVSMSLGSAQPTDGTDPMAAAVDALSQQTGALFVIASGNGGRVGGIGSPGSAADALTVGAVDSKDVRAYFSDMGPRLGDGAVKPEIVAPGVSILAARSQQASGSGFYQTMSGTSMATPHVAGAAAIIAQEHPSWTGQQIKEALVSTAKPLDNHSAYEVGGGRLDIPSTMDADILATGTRAFGFFDWPHGDEAPVDRTITYTNLGDTDVTLDLSTHMTDIYFEPAPDGLVTLSASQVIVPAGGTADVTATAAPDLAVPGSGYAGEVIASVAGEQVAQTAVGLVKEGERYDLDVNVLDRSGNPAGGYLTLYRYTDQSVTTLPIDPVTGKVGTQRLRPGIYNVTTWLPLTGSGDSRGVALLGNPHVVIENDAQLTLDARDANPITVRTPRASEDTVRRPGYVHDSELGGQYDTFVNQYGVSPAVDTVYAAPTGEVPGVYEFLTRWRRTAPLITMTTDTDETLHPLLQSGAKRWDGKASLSAINVGAGSAAEYAGVDARGKAVLITRSDAVTPRARAEAARAAGAAVLLVVNDQAGKLFEWAGGTDLPVYSLTAAEGRPLLDRLASGPVGLRIKGTEASPYLYDLVKAYQGEIPGDLSYAPTAASLATITNRFVGPDGVLALEARGDCRSWNWPPCLMVTDPIHLGTTRVDYVSTQEGGGWYQQTSSLSGNWDQRGDQVSYVGGTEHTSSWFAPVVRPRVGPGYWHPRRSGDFFAVNVPTASSGDQGVTGSMGDTSTVATRLFQNGVLLRKSSFQAIQATVPATGGWADYRFEMDTTRPDVWKHGTRTATAWDFKAQTTEGDDWAYLPLVQVDYHLATDLRGALTAGTRHTFGLTAFHLEDVEGAGSIDDATLQVSYDDGATWQAVSLSRKGNGAWNASVLVPKQGAEFISLRATAADDAGNSITQEVIRAASVR